MDLDLTPEKWREDLRYFETEVPKRHINPFHALTREKFAAAVRLLNDRIPALKKEEIFCEFMKLSALFGDGHFSVRESALFDLGFYPMHYEIFADGLFIESADAEYRDIVGGRVTKIGNTPIDTAIKQLSELAWGDNYSEQSKKVEIVFLLTNPLVLKGLKIAESLDSVPVTVEINGQQRTAVLTPRRDIAAYSRTAKRADAADGSTAPLPLYRKDENNNYWSEYLADRKVLYVQFNAVENRRDESIETFFRKVFDFVETNPVEKLVLDIRANTGGNNRLNRPVTVGLVRSRLNVRGRLFVITGRRTFSAAQNLVNEIEKYTEAIFVGEPTGSSPNSYGDPVIVTLPNSRIPFRVPTLLHQFDPRDTRVGTTPEIFIEPTSEDYKMNRDPVFQAILDYAPGAGFKDIVAEFARTKDLSAFLTRYKAFRSDPRNKYSDTQAGMNTLGYRLLGDRKVNEAIEVFKLNSEAYPASANVWDSLAEAYLTGGNKEEAVKNYERALKIDPNFASSEEALKKLKAP
jgi:tetratricopeptide (TPR) repeat protein